MRSWLLLSSWAAMTAACGGQGAGSPSDALDVGMRVDGADSASDAIRTADATASDGRGGMDAADAIDASTDAGGDATSFDGGGDARDATVLDVVGDAAGDSAGDIGSRTDADGDGGTAVVCVGDTLAANRNRLMESYFRYLRADVTQPQTNGLSGTNVASAMDVWQKLDPSARAVFLTITARMQGSVLGADLTSMLSHVTKIYRIAGGQGATLTDPGSCGGGEYNRLIMSMDPALSTALRAANTHQGARQSNGRYDISDVVSSSFWRDSHDLGGAHSPFDQSDETDQGAPRGQTQYFADPTSTLANSPLNRQDLTTLVDPFALEMDQDYNCPHDSNPLCSYTTYGPFCIPESSETGTQLYTDSYGDFQADWQPQSCGP